MRGFGQLLASLANVRRGACGLDINFCRCNELTNLIVKFARKTPPFLLLELDATARKSA